jgi:inner membrane protein
MDPLTHALSGALFARLVCVRPAQAPIPHEVARVLAPAGRFSSAWDHSPGHLAPWQAMVVGAAAAAFPDIDALALLGGDFLYLRHHRGVTHSVLLAPLWAWLIAALGARWFESTRERPGGWKALYGLALGGLLLHIAGDWITTYGTMLLAPFTDHRFGLGAVFIIDLALSGILAAGLAAAARFPARRWPAALGLLAASAWVGLAWWAKQEAETAARAHAQAEGLRVEWLDAMPRPASPFNWTLAIFDGHDYHLANVNLFRNEPLPTSGADSLWRRLTAPYRPLAQAQWVRVPRFGGENAPVWVAEAWAHEAFATFRWFAVAPALLLASEREPQDGRCAAFRDLRFEFPGRNESPFQFALCLREGGAASVWRIGGMNWRQL